MWLTWCSSTIPSTSLICLDMKTLSTTPRPYCWKAEILNFLHVLLVWGVTMMPHAHWLSWSRGVEQGQARHKTARSQGGHWGLRLAQNLRDKITHAQKSAKLFALLEHVWCAHVTQGVHLVTNQKMRHQSTSSLPTTSERVASGLLVAHRDLNRRVLNWRYTGTWSVVALPTRPRFFVSLRALLSFSPLRVAPRPPPHGSRAHPRSSGPFHQGEGVTAGTSACFDCAAAFFHSASSTAVHAAGSLAGVPQDGGGGK